MANKYFNLKELRRKPRPSDGAYGGTFLFSAGMSRAAGFLTCSFLQIRGSGEFKDKGFYLDNDYNWEIVKDKEGMMCLVPTKKDGITYSV